MYRMAEPALTEEAAVMKTMMEECIVSRRQISELLLSFDGEESDCAARHLHGHSLYRHVSLEDAREFQYVFHTTTS